MATRTVVGVAAGAPAIPPRKSAGNKRAAKELLAAAEVNDDDGRLAIVDAVDGTSTAPSPALSRLVPALPLAEAQAAAAAEMLVCIEPTYWARLKGSRAQLEAEGVIPKGTKWPEGTTKARWEAGNLKFELFRSRPDGLKGPMKLWTNGDYWTLDVDVKGRDYTWRQHDDIRRKAKALADEIHRQSPAGRREWDLSWARYWKAKYDTAYQSFKALMVPEPKKRGRPAKVRPVGTTQGAQS